MVAANDIFKVCASCATSSCPASATASAMRSVCKLVIIRRF